MRARLHVRNGRIGFFREGTHSLCDAAATRQLSDAAAGVIAALERNLNGNDAISGIELSENIPGSERALHFELRPDGDASRLAVVAQVNGVSGATCAHAENPRTLELFGSPYVADTIAGASLQRHARSFFQGNRFLTPVLVEYVLSLIERSPVLDLYAGVGLFSITADRSGRGPVTAVEGDRFSSSDLKRNAEGYRVTVKVDAVERFLDRVRDRYATVIVDPPRTGMSKDALKGVMSLSAPRLVYVSCDVATLARDARAIVDAGYRMQSMRAFDLFPNTAHVETVIAFAK
jgi:23S rRNA (uracil1939-C5)-methyltransferase